MLKFIFWSLLCINGALLAYGQGVLGKVGGNEREPARMKNQLNADKLTLLSATQANAAATGQAQANAATANQAQAAAAAAKKPEPELIACTEIGTFVLADAKRFEKQVDKLALGERQSRRNVAVAEITSHIVYIPALGSKDAAELKVAELRQMGVTNYFIMSDNSPMKWAISLGVFKSAGAAQNLLATLNKQGVQSARMTGKSTTSNRLAYQFRDIDAGTRTRLEQIKEAFPAQELHDCK